MILFWLSFGRCLSRLAWLLPIAGILAVVGAHAEGNGMTIGEGDAAAMWLHLPLFVTALAASATAVESWPLFARERPGAGWIERLRPGPWRGCGAAGLGALAAAACGCIAVGVAAPLLAPLPAPRAQLDLCGHGDVQVLAGEVAELQFEVPPDLYEAVLLRPRAFLPRAELVPTTLLLSSAGSPLSAASIEVASTERLVRVAFPPQQLSQLQLRRTGGTVPLAFPPGSLLAVAAAPHSALANVLLAALLYLLPMFTALAAVGLGSRALSLPFALLLLLLLLLIMTLGGIAPTGEAMAAVLRGRWLIGTGVFRAGLPSLGAGALAMILAMNLPRRTAR